MNYRIIMLFASVLLASCTSLSENKHEEHSNVQRLPADILFRNVNSICASNYELQNDWHQVADTEGSVLLYSKFSDGEFAYRGEFSKREWGELDKLGTTSLAIHECQARVIGTLGLNLIAVRANHEPGLLEAERIKRLMTALNEKIDIRASRIFSGPNQYPPSNFKAYGIVAFRTRDVNYGGELDRHDMFCNAFVSAIPHVSEVKLDIQNQMVTVWPIQNDYLAKYINSMPRQKVCEFARERYGLVLAQNAIQDAERASVELKGSGPFLIAWSPAKDKGKSNVPVLISNLSDVTNFEEAKFEFSNWIKNIESDPEIWDSGLNIDLIKTKIRRWADQNGKSLISLFNSK